MYYHEKEETDNKRSMRNLYDALTDNIGVICEENPEAVRLKRMRREVGRTVIRHLKGIVRS